LDHTTSSFLVWLFWRCMSLKLFPWAGLKPWSSQSTSFSFFKNVTAKISKCRQSITLFSNFQQIVPTPPVQTGLQLSTGKYAHGDIDSGKKAFYYQMTMLQTKLDWTKSLGESHSLRTQISSINLVFQ
jgi:hypothetical protein